MLKSHRDLTRWYGPLEPERTAPSTPTAADRMHSEAHLEDDVHDEVEQQSYGRIRMLTQPPAESAVEADETPAVPAETGPGAEFPQSPRQVGARVEPLHEAAGHRAGYVGGWDEWMSADARSEQGTAPLIPLATGAEPDTGRDLRPILLFALAAAVVVAVIGVGIVILTGVGSGTRVTPKPVGPVATSAASPPAMSGSTTEQAAGPVIPGCAEERSEAVVSGAGPGGSDSGPDAILWFQHSYYDERSGTRAREVVAPDADVPTAETIQKGIDSIPLGTAHCVRITPIGDGRFSVELTEAQPGQQASRFQQIVTTSAADGRTVITGIKRG